MRPFHWVALGMASAMVTTLVGAAVLMPASGGTTVAQARFAAQPTTDYQTPATALSSADNAAQARDARALNAIDTAAGPTALARAALGYDLSAVRQGLGDVPRVSLVRLPSDLHRIRETDQRKAVFLKTVLPLVLQVNEQITEDRHRLWRLDAVQKSGERISAVDRLWLAVMAERYGVKRGDVGALLKRHDIVPPSMAMAQAATESAWGTSRFVKEGNAMFGEWTFSAKQKGIVPNGRTAGKTHRIRAFDSLYESVLSYATNLNKHRAYKEFRAARAEMRRRGQTLDGLRLATTLHRYSERGAAYVAELHAIILGNDLQLLDGARLTRLNTDEPVI